MRSGPQRDGERVGFRVVDDFHKLHFFRKRFLYFFRIYVCSFKKVFNNIYSQGKLFFVVRLNFMSRLIT